MISRTQQKLGLGAACLLTLLGAIGLILWESLSMSGATHLIDDFSAQNTTNTTLTGTVRFPVGQPDWLITLFNVFSQGGLELFCLLIGYFIHAYRMADINTVNAPIDNQLEGALASGTVSSNSDFSDEEVTLGSALISLEAEQMRLKKLEEENSKLRQLLNAAYSTSQHIAPQPSAPPAPADSVLYQQPPLLNMTEQHQGYGSVQQSDQGHFSQYRPN